MISIQKEIQLISQYLPNGGIWNDKIDDNTQLRVVVVALANVINKLRNYSFEIEKELNIYTTNNFITYWEHLVGLPDELFTQTTTLSFDERLQQVLFKLTGLKAKTRPEIAKLIKNLFNVDITFMPKGSGYKNGQTFDYHFDYYLSDPSTDHFYTIIRIDVESSVFDYDFDYVLQGDKTPIETIVKSLIDFDKVGFVLFAYRQ